MQGQSDQADSFKKCVEEAAVVLRSQINHKNEATTLKKLLGGLNIPRALTSEHTGETGWKMSKAFDIEPLNPYSLDNWDEDLACSNTKQSQESEGDEQDRWDETEESELSEFEDDEDIENYASERAIDTKLTEDDKIEDLIYEEKLWELINGKNVMINPELDEKEKIAENSENEAGFSNAENQDDDDDDDEEENILALDLQESSSDDESEQSIDEDIQDNLQADKTRLKDGGSPARQSNTTSRDEGEDEEGYDEEHEGPRKRQRTSQSGRTPWARRSDTDEERSRKKKRSKSEKTRYRTQEFISTSDEEDE